MSATQYPRRGFLRQLCTLPMLGGGVTLLGAPTAVAEPVTAGLIDAYDDFLSMEKALLREEWPRRKVLTCEPPSRTDDAKYTQWAVDTLVAYKTAELLFEERVAILRATPTFNSPASTRAALVLSAVGFDWKTAQAFR